jgi:hypothetical protein
VNDLVLVEEPDLEQAIVMLLEVEKTLVEGAGAAGLAALLAHRERFRGRKVGLVLCGGNIDPLLLSAIIGHGLVRAGRLVRLKVSTRDVPGSLAKITTVKVRSSSKLRKVTLPTLAALSSGVVNFSFISASVIVTTLPGTASAALVCSASAIVAVGATSIVGTLLSLAAGC